MFASNEKQLLRTKVQLKHDNFDKWLFDLKVLMITLGFSIKKDKIIDTRPPPLQNVKQEQKQQPESQSLERRKEAAFVIILRSISLEMNWLVENIDIEDVDIDELWLRIYSHYKASSTNGKLEELTEYLKIEMTEGTTFDEFVEKLRHGQKKVNALQEKGIEINDRWQLYKLTRGVLAYNHNIFHPSVVLLDQRIAQGSITFDEAVQELRVVARRHEERERDVIALAAINRKEKAYIYGRIQGPGTKDCRHWLKKGQCDYGENCHFRHDEEKGKQARDREARLQRDGGGRIKKIRSNGELVCPHCKGKHLPSKCPKKSADAKKNEDQAHAVVEDVGFHPDEE